MKPTCAFPLLLHRTCLDVSLWESDAFAFGEDNAECDDQVNEE